MLLMIQHLLGGAGESHQNIKTAGVPPPPGHNLVMYSCSSMLGDPVSKNRFWEWCKLAVFFFSTEILFCFFVSCVNNRVSFQIIYLSRRSRPQ